MSLCRQWLHRTKAHRPNKVCTWVMQTREYNKMNIQRAVKCSSVSTGKGEGETGVCYYSCLRCLGQEGVVLVLCSTLNLVSLHLDVKGEG